MVLVTVLHRLVIFADALVDHIQLIAVPLQAVKKMLRQVVLFFQVLADHPFAQR